MKSEIETLYAVVDATWPAATAVRAGPWTIRDGQGGGKRVSAATAEEPVRDGDLPRAEVAMRALGQTPLFMIREWQGDLDRGLELRGYKVIDPVNVWFGPVAPLISEPLPRARVFTVWPPLAIQNDIWAKGGIGSARLAVMERAPGPRTSILGRWDHTPAATAFVAIHDGIAMIHALEVAEPCRRKGMAGLVVRQAAFWAAENGASRISALCTQGNTPTNTLYSSMGLGLVGQYHYRIAQEDDIA